MVAALLAVAPSRAAGSPEPGAVILLLPLQNRAGDRGAGEAVEAALGRRLAELGELIERDRARDALRRRRVRNVEDTAPEALSAVAGELAADLLVSATLHDAERRGLPRLALSARAYGGKDGSLVWSGFVSGSGLDDRRLLGLGVITELEALVPGLVDDLLNRDLHAVLDPPADAENAPSAETPLGSVAVVPFTSITEQRQYATAETATEATRAVLYRHGVPITSPGCAAAVIRRLQGGRWGGIDVEARLALKSECGADSVITGSLELYEVDGTLREPEPRVAIGVRLVDAASGRILWTSGGERGGWDHGGPFRLRRIHARGELTERMLERMTRDLLKKRRRAVARPENS